MSNNIDKPLAYAGYSIDDNIRYRSSSGGIFSEIAKYIIKQNGVVFGCALDENMYARHICIDNIKDLKKLRGSKYVQSDMGDSYKECASYLKKNRIVLFTGTPCQIEALLRYLSYVVDEEMMKKLYTQDLICHGAPSPEVWNHYLKLQGNKHGKIKSVNFRDKEYGWNNYAICMEFKDGTIEKKVSYKNSYLKGFVNNLYLRPSCYNCNFKKVNRKSDITLADFWGISNIFPDLSDGKGISLLIVHTKKGEDLLRYIEEKVYLRKVNVDNAIQYNPSMIQSSKVKIEKRNEFFAKYNLINNKKDWHNFIDKLVKKNIVIRCCNLSKRCCVVLLKKVGIR